MQKVQKLGCLRSQYGDGVNGYRNGLSNGDIYLPLYPSFPSSLRLIGLPQVFFCEKKGFLEIVDMYFLYFLLNLANMLSYLGKRVP
jgi:hypothetical protein